MPARKTARAAAAAIASTFGVSAFPTKMPRKHSTNKDPVQIKIVRAHQLSKLTSLTAQPRPDPALPENTPPTRDECGFSETGIYTVDTTQLRGLYFRLRTECLDDIPTPTRVVGGIIFDTRTNPLYYEDIWKRMVHNFTKRAKLSTIEPYVGQYFTLVIENALRAVPMVVESISNEEEPTKTFCARQVDVFNGDLLDDDVSTRIAFRITRRRKSGHTPGFYEWITDSPHAKGTVYWSAFVEWDWIE